MAETPKPPTTPPAINPSTTKQDLQNQTETLAQLNFENAKFLASLEARMKLASALSEVELKFMKDLTANLRMQNELVDAYNAKFEKNKDKIRELIEEREEMESLDDDKRKARLKQINAAEEENFNNRKRMLKEENSRLVERRTEISIQAEQLRRERDEINLRIQSGDKLTREEIKQVKEKNKTYKEYEELYQKINSTIQQNTDLINENFVAETDLGRAIEKVIDRKKEEMLIDMHNIRASEILRDTKQKLINTADKLTISSARLGETLSGSLAIAIVRTGSLFESLKEINNFMVLKFSNPEILMGSFFKFIEDNAIKSFNFVKSNVLELDKSVTAFNKTTGQGEMFRREVSALAGETTKFNATLKEGGEAFEKFYKNFQGFTKLTEAQRQELVLTGLKYDQLGFSIDKQAKLFNTLSGSLTKNTAQFEKLRKELVETAITLKMATDDVVSNFERNIEKFNVYGTKGVEVFKNLQTASKNLKIDFDSLIGVIGQFDQFEAAAQSAGKFNAALGGDYLNALEMIGMKEDERLIRLKQAFDATGMNVDVMNKQQLQLLANASGFKTTAEAMKFFGSSMSDILARQNEQIDLDNLATKSADITKRLTILGEKLLVMITPIVPIIESIVGGIAKFADSFFGKFLFGAVGLFVAIAGSLTGIVSLFSFFYSLAMNARMIFSAIGMIFKDKGLALKQLITLQEKENIVASNQLSTEQAILATERQQTAELEKQVALKAAGGGTGGGIPAVPMTPTGAPNMPVPGIPTKTGGGAPVPTAAGGINPVMLGMGLGIGGAAFGAGGAALTQSGHNQAGKFMSIIGGAMSGASMGMMFAPLLGPLAPFAPIIGGLAGGVIAGLSDAIVDKDGNVTPLKEGTLDQKGIVINGKFTPVRPDDEMRIGTKLKNTTSIEIPKTGEENKINFLGLINGFTDNLIKNLNAGFEEMSSSLFKFVMPLMETAEIETKTPEIKAQENKIVDVVTRKLEEQTERSSTIQATRVETQNTKMDKILAEKQKLPEKMDANINVALNIDMEKYAKGEREKLLQVVSSKLNYYPVGGIV